MPLIKELQPAKNIALVAHDGKKEELLQWAERKKENLALHTLYATGTTGALLEAALGRHIHKFLSGPLGGDQQIGAQIAEGKIEVLLFFWDPMEAQPHEPDVRALLRLSTLYNIPVASNPATADFLFSSPYMQQTYRAEQADYSKYVRRSLNL